MNDLVGKTVKYLNKEYLILGYDTTDFSKNVYRLNELVNNQSFLLYTLTHKKSDLMYMIRDLIDYCVALEVSKHFICQVPIEEIKVLKKPKQDVKADSLKAVMSGLQLKDFDYFLDMTNKYEKEHKNEIADRYIRFYNRVADMMNGRLVLYTTIDKVGNQCRFVYHYPNYVMKGKLFTMPKDDLERAEVLLRFLNVDIRYKNWEEK